MICDQVVLGRIAARWQPGGLFASAAENLIGTWCVEHHRKYGQPPGKQISVIYEQWASAKQDASMVELVGNLLAELSRQYERDEQLASDYILDVAAGVFDAVALRKLVEATDEDLEANDVTKARRRMAEWRSVELGTGSTIKLQDDPDVWQEAFDPDTQRPLVHYSGALGKFFSGALVRESLIAFMGPDKSGKSWMILDVAYRAMRNRCRVAYIEAGDLMRDAVSRRLGQRASRRPLYKGSFKVPNKITKADDGSGKFLVERDDVPFDEALEGVEAYRAFRKACRGRDVFRMACYPINTITVQSVRGLLLDWSRDNWVADVVVIDYADILAPPVGYRETNDQIDEQWKQLRRLSQELHCLVVTATQSSALAYSSTAALRAKHFSGRKTKLAHVDGMVGINSSEEERKDGIVRLNWVVRRNADWSPGAYVGVAGCLALGCPTVCSAF